MARKVFVMVVLTLGIIMKASAAEPTSAETWTVEGKTFTTKGEAVRFVVASGKRLTISHTRCEILTNKLSFKACPKNKTASFENEQFESLSKTK